MQFTDLFIRKPVLATVVSLMILVMGLRSIASLTVSEYPYTENGVITVTTTYTGADPALIAGFITTPLENSIAQANGIDYLTSSSTQNTSTITANLRLNYDSDKALTEINAQVNAVLNQLPEGAQQPVLTISIGEAIDSMYIGFNSKVIPSNKVTDYLTRVVQPKLQAINGVQEAQILGGEQFALRAWLDPAKLAAYNLTTADIAQALAANDFISAVGRTDGQMITLNLTADTGLHTVKEFRNLIVKSENGAIVRLGDVANVTLGAQNYNSTARFNRDSGVFIGIQVTPTANLLTVINQVKAALPAIQAQLPQGLDSKIVYDATDYVNSSIKEVITSLFEALLIVTVVIFIFLGSVRSVIIPTIAMPLSIIGAFFIMLALGYSINLLTLLALVLAIGLVVDDAIIVVENVHRHIEDGMTPLNAAIQGARELASPIIAITIVLIAVYAPIGFMGGLTGALFTQFAFTLAAAVFVSAVIALTLSPMMCSKFFKAVDPKHNHKNKFITFIDYYFDKLRDTYGRALHHALNFLPVVILFAVVILTSIFFLFITSQSELAPQEDQGFIMEQLTAAPNANIGQSTLNSEQVDKVFYQFPETESTFQIDGNNGLNTNFGGMVLTPWDKRTRTTMQLQPLVQKSLNQIAGAKIAAFQQTSLPGGGSGLPFQFVIKTTQPYDRMDSISKDMINKGLATGMFLYFDSDLKIDKAQSTVVINRDKASQLGLTMQDVGNVLATALGGNYINYFSLSGRSYQVIPQVMRVNRLNPDQLLNYYITTSGGNSVPLATIASVQNSTVPEEINHFQQLNSATLSGVLAPGVTQGRAIETLNKIAKTELPQDYNVDYAGQTRQFTQESNALLITFLLAMIIIFLSLAALFESFRDPLIVMISVPMSICGAMIFISMGIGGATLNIYTEVGLVTLIGLISKHGILIVQFANDLQEEGKSKLEAIQMAATIRLRPILMTTAAMVLGVVPLLTASGAGAVSRFDIGLVISTGISIGTVFTLFVVPAMYMILAENKSKNLGIEPAAALVST